MEIVQINGLVEVAGLNDDKPYIEMTTRLCWLDYANLNGVGISSAAEESFKTLIGMPVVAKINSKGTKFGSHEVSIDDKGEIKFNTSAYGVHTDVWVAEEEVDLPNVGLTNVPCLFAKSRIWKRFSSVVELIANKLENPEEYNGGLWSSWELQGSEHHFNDNKEKIYDKFSFISNCLIDVPPAYSSTSKTLAIASQSFETELCSAYLDDINVNQDIDSSKALNINNNVPKEETILTDTNTSSLTTRDLHQKISTVLNPKGWSSNPYYSIWEVYPEDHKILAYDIDRDSEDTYLVFPYSVSEDNINIGEAVETKLSKIIAERTNVNISLDLNETAKLLSEKETEISRITNEKEKISTELSEKVEALISASEKIGQLESTVAELTPFKEQVEEIKRVEQEAELATKKEDLKKVALKGGCISKEELETSEEIKGLIDSLDEKGIKSIIADRFIQKLDENPTSFETSQSNKKDVSQNYKRTITDEESVTDHKVVMSSFLKN